MSNDFHPDWDAMAALDEYVDYEASAILKEHFGVEE